MEVGVHAPGLANHYFDLAPDTPVSFGWAIGQPNTRYLWWIHPPNVVQQTLDPVVGVITGFVGKPGVFLLQQGRIAEDVSSRTSSTLAGKVADPSLVWTSPVEPGSRSGQLDLDVLGLAMSADGTEVNDLALVQDAGIVAGTETVDSPSFLPFSSGPPISRHQFQVVLSRTASTLFVLGGVDPQSQKPLTDIWMQVSGQRWSKLVIPGYAPYSLLASTFSFADRHLWILDEVVDSRGRFDFRLVRIDPFASSPNYKIVAKGPGNEASSYSMGLDRDGALLLDEASSRGTVITRITVGERPQIRVVRFEAARLARPPIVDDFGYAFLVLASDGSFSVERHSQTEGNCNGIFPFLREEP